MEQLIGARAIVVEVVEQPIGIVLQVEGDVFGRMPQVAVDENCSLTFLEGKRRS